MASEVFKLGIHAFQEFFSSKSQGHHHPYKVLLIGETGSGKTSFLNLLCNYAVIKKLGGFETALDKFRNFNDIKLENALSNKMESKTSGTALYNVELNGLKIGVIDTPGFGDSRGMDEDKRHIKRIVAGLREVDHVNCVCLVINGRASRMTGLLQYVLAEITAILPKKIFDNIAVVLTNTSNVLQKNFKLDSLTEYFGKKVEKVFYIENPYCEFEKAKEMKDEIPIELIAESLKEGFEKTGKMLDKLHESIKNLKAVHTHHFTRLYEKRIEIERKVLDILAEYDSQVNLSKEMERKQEEVVAARKTKKLHKNFQTYTIVTRWVRKDTSYHNTLCGAPGCYKTCHEKCGLDKSFNPEIFQRCSGIGGITCKECGHNYRSHYHDEVKMIEETTKEPLINDEMKKKFEEADSADKIAAIALGEIEKKIKNSEEQKKELSKKLLLAMEDFHQLGMNKNYANLLHKHLYTIQTRKKASNNKKDIASLTKTEEQIIKQIKIVEAALEEPWSRQADPQIQKEWAIKMLELDPSRRISPADIDKSFHQLSLEMHPDKQGNASMMKKINHARDILKDVI